MCTAKTGCRRLGSLNDDHSGQLAVQRFQSTCGSEDDHVRLAFIIVNSASSNAGLSRR